MERPILVVVDVVAATLELSRAEMAGASVAAAPATGAVQSIVGVGAPGGSTAIAVQGPGLEADVPNLDLVGLTEVDVVLGGDGFEKLLLGHLDGLLLRAGDGSGDGRGRSRQDQENVRELHDEEVLSLELTDQR